MSLSLRPVKIMWYAHSSLFVEDHEAFEWVIEEGCNLVWDHCRKNEAAEVQEYYWENGKAFLQKLRKVNVGEVIRRLKTRTEDAESTETDVRNLVCNLKNLVPKWRKAIGEDGSFLLWVDF